jgi:glucosamine-6-phosphate deaminase
MTKPDSTGTDSTSSHLTGQLQTVIVTDATTLALRAADEIALEIARKPNLSLLAATGNTPMATYGELASRRAAGTLEVPNLRVAQLDEYLGVSDDDPRSLYRWLERSLTEPLGVTPERLLRFHADASDPNADCRNFETHIAGWGGIDLAVLGLGPNGHLGFNEPPSPTDAPTRVVDLTAESLESNAPYWNGLEVPRRAITAGMDLILASKRILLLVSGEHKRGILHRALLGPITSDVPASLLRGANLTVIADQAAWGEA